ncbi:cysteine--tRNA ligase [Nocardioides sp.]|uniref:cysteine--tRNA ligase n=1 Tax=Nocardioides sp. TaxID=35761 RepID=UPI002B27A092|nr:cysteine--tRNA ligase [Nocardioides sp.]
MASRPIQSGVVDARQRVGSPPARPTSLSLGGTTVAAVGSARLYVCGITPYDVTHLGHASTFVWADVIASVLDASGVRPRVCRNITDVDDVLMEAARSKGRHFDEYALVQQSLFEQSMRALRVGTPAEEPRARHHIEAVQQLAQALLDLGVAYERDGTVWFRAGDVVERSGLSRERALELSADYGDAPDDPAKDDPFDVPVWRASSDDDPAWISPWGWGRPGWHAECAAMAWSVHGPSVDVLVGGEDLAFPHHAYQSAMVEAVSGFTPFARAVLHVGEVRIDGAKMAKSTGNLVLVDDILQGCSPAALRLLLLARPYGEAWDYEPSRLAEAEGALQRLYAAAGRAGSSTDPDSAVALLREDLDVAGACARAEADGGEVARRLITALRLG